MILYVRLSKTDWKSGNSVVQDKKVYMDLTCAPKEQVKEAKRILACASKLQRTLRKLGC